MPSPPDEKIRLWNGLLNNLLEIKEYDRAKQLCRQIAREHPHDAMIRYRLLELALVTYDARDPAASLAELDRVLAEIDGIAGQGPLWLYGKAVRLKLEAGQGKPELLDAAMDYARQGAEHAAGLVAAPRPAGRNLPPARQRRRGPGALLAGLDQRRSRSGLHPPPVANALRAAALPGRRAGDPPLGQQPDASDPRHRAAKRPRSLPSGANSICALELANRAYNPASNDYRDHVWHGQVLTLLARRAQQEGHQDKLPEIAEQAEESLRRACQLAPNTPDCRVALVQLLVATNQMAKARIAANDAEEMIPLAASPLAMGYIYEALGETARRPAKATKRPSSSSPTCRLAIRMLADFYLRNRRSRRAAPLIERLLERRSASQRKRSRQRPPHEGDHPGQAGLSQAQGGHRA